MVYRIEKEYQRADSFRWQDLSGNSNIGWQAS